MKICVLKNRTIQIKQRNIANRHNTTQLSVGFLAFPCSVPFRVRIEMSFSMNILQSCRIINSTQLNPSPNGNHTNSHLIFLTIWWIYWFCSC